MGEHLTTTWPPCAAGCGLGPVCAHDRDDRPLPGTDLWCSACGHRWTASADDRAQAEREDARWARHNAEAWARSFGVSP